MTYSKTVKKKQQKNRKTKEKKKKKIEVWNLCFV